MVFNKLEQEPETFGTDETRVGFTNVVLSEQEKNVPQRDRSQVHRLILRVTLTLNCEAGLTLYNTIKKKRFSCFILFMVWFLKGKIRKRCFFPVHVKLPGVMDKPEGDCLLEFLFSYNLSAIKCGVIIIIFSFFSFSGFVSSV